MIKKPVRKKLLKYNYDADATKQKNNNIVLLDAKTNLIINHFKNSGSILEFLKKENNIMNDIFYFNYVNYKSKNKLNLIIESLKILLDTNIKYRFENLILIIEIEKKINKIIPLENYINKIEKNKNMVLFGADASGAAVCDSLYNIKSLLIGGASGSGKSNLIHNIIISLLLFNDNVNLLLIDMKAAELTRYNIFLKNKRLIKPVATDFKSALKIIILFYCIIKKRFSQMQRGGLQYSNESPIVLVIDEAAQLSNNNKEKKVINNYLCKIAALGRAANCFLILATQHPTNENITNSIRVNLQSKLALKCSNSIQSKNIINDTAAAQLVNPGDMILHIDGKQPQKIKACYVSNQLLNRFININK